MNKDLFRVDLTLKDIQRVGFNIYKCTLDGERREVLDKHVRFHLTDLTKISSTFDLDELESVSITWTNTNFGTDGHGNKIYF